MPFTQQDLLETVLAIPVDGDRLQHILDEFLEREEYINCHDHHGKLLGDNLLSRGAGPCAITIRKYESALEEKRKNRIPSELFRAVVDGNLSFIQTFPNIATLVPSAMSYLFGVAIQKGHDAIVHYFVENCHADVNGLGPHGELPLFLAANAGNLECMRYLIAHGANPRLEGIKLNKTIIHEAVNLREESLMIVNYLVTTLGFNINERRFDGGTVLHIAAKHGLTSMAQGLLALRVDTTIRNLSGQTAADIASEEFNFMFMQEHELRQINQGRIEVLAVIHDHEKELSRREQVLQALAKQDASIINLANLHINNHDVVTIIDRIIKLGQVVHVDLSGNELTDRGVQELQTLLFSRTQVITVNLERNQVSPEAIQSMKQAIAADSRLNHLLQQYSSSEFGDKHLDEFIFLHQQGAQLNCIEHEGWLLIHYAAYYGNEGLIKYLVAQTNCDISLTTREGEKGEKNNVLHLAVLGNKEDKVTALILLTQTGRDLLRTNQTKKTPLLIAVEQGKLHCVDVLLKVGDNPNYQMPSGNTALKIVAKTKIRQPEIFQLLLEKGAIFNPEIRDEFEPPLKPSDVTDAKLIKIIEQYENNEQSLFTSVLKEDTASLERLVNQGINLQCHDKEGHSPLFIALTQKKFTSAGFLLCEGAQLSKEEERNNNPFESLRTEERNELKMKLFTFFSRPKEAIVAYFVSRTHFANRHSSLLHSAGEIGKLYTQLYEKDIFRPIMEVLEYAPNLIDIIIDTSVNHVKRADPTQEETTNGSCNFKNGKIYLGANRDPRSLLGTLAHELTHMACQVLYGNDCNPYPLEESVQQKEFLEILRLIKIDYEKDNSHYDPIIARVFSYAEKSQPSELIVRVPQIVIQYDTGEEILKQQAESLRNFYLKVLLPAFHEYIENRKSVHIQSGATNISYRDFLDDNKTEVTKNEQPSVHPLLQSFFVAQAGVDARNLDQTQVLTVRRGSYMI